MSRATPQIGHAELCTTTASFLGHEIFPSVCGIVARQGLNFRRKFATVKPMTDQDEITRLKNEIAQLQARLEAQQLPIRSTTTPLIENFELLQDLARYCEGIVTERNVRKKHKLAESDWERLGSDEAFIEVIKRCREARVRNGAAAREKAQQVFVEAPTVLGEILSDKSANPRHRIEASRELRATASVGPEAQPTTEMFTININIGEDYRLQVSQPIRPTPGTIEQESLLIEDDNAKSI
jgi:hypothetical protein